MGAFLVAALGFAAGMVLVAATRPIPADRPPTLWVGLMAGVGLSLAAALFFAWLLWPGSGDYSGTEFFDGRHSGSMRMPHVGFWLAAVIGGFILGDVRHSEVARWWLQGVFVLVFWPFFVDWRKHGFVSWIGVAAALSLLLLLALLILLALAVQNIPG